MAELLLEHVSKVFAGGVEAVRDLDLHVADGETVSVLGPSGSGKTTLLRLIAGLEDATAGTIRFDGRPADGLPPRQRNVAMVFQDDALYPHLTVRGNLGFGATMRRLGREEVRRRVDEAARLLGLADLLDRLPRALSGGERRRVALGRTVVIEPACTLYDEPLGGLDAGLKRRLRLELKGLHRRMKRTGLYVTHDQAEALSLGDRVLVLAGGHVRQVGTPREVYEQPADRFVAGFVGDPPMSFLEGRLQRVEGGRLLFEEHGGLQLRLPDSLARPVAGHARTTVVLGIRPGGLRPAGDDAAAVTLRVEQIDPIGDHVDVLGRTPGGSPVTARVPAGEQLRPGENAVFSVDPAALHLFESGEFGRRLV